MKALMQPQDLGPVRLPLVDLTEAEAKTMINELEKTILYQEYFANK